MLIFFIVLLLFVFSVVFKGYLAAKKGAKLNTSTERKLAIEQAALHALDKGMNPDQVRKHKDTLLKEEAKISERNQDFWNSLDKSRWSEQRRSEVEKLLGDP